MASSAVVGALRVDLVANSVQLEDGLKRGKMQLQDFGKEVKRISGMISGASFLFNSGAQAAQRFAQASQGILNVASLFEKGMANVSTLIDTSSESLSQMSEAVLAIGRRTPVALTELTTALYDIRSAGIDAGDAIGVLENSARLAVAGLGTTKEAVDVVTSAINAFGLKGADAEKVYDNIFKTVKAGKTTISGIAQGFGAVAGTVAQAGIALDDYLASVAALTTTGLPAAQAHTQIRAAIAGLLRETEETKALFDALNVKTFKELVKQSGSVVVAFQRILGATQGNDAAIIKILGSVEAYNAVIGLAGKQNEAFRKTLGDMRLGADAVGAAFDKQNDTVAAAMQRLTNATQELGIALGNALAPFLKQIASFVEGVTTAFKSLSPEMQQIIAAIGAFALVVGPAVIAAGFFANALAALIPIFGAIGAVIAGLLAAAGPIGLLIGAAAAATAAWTFFQDDIITIWNNIAEVIQAKAMDIIKSIFQLEYAIFKAFAQFKAGNLTGAFDTIKEALTPLQGFETTIERIGEKSTQLATVTMPALATSFRDGIVTPAAEATNALQQLIDKQRLHAEQTAQTIMKDLASPLDLYRQKLMEIKDAQDLAGLSADAAGMAQKKAAMVTANAYASMASGIAQNLATAFGNNKAFAIAAAIINTAEAVTKSLATYGATPWGFAAAAAAAAAGAAQIAAIRKTNKGGSGGEGGGGATAAAAAPAAQPQQQQALFVSGLSSDQLFSGDVVRGLVEKIADFTADGGRVVFAR